MSRQHYLFLPGIKHKAQHSDSWVDHAVSWVHRYTEHRADKYEYESPALFRWMGQAARVKDVVRWCRREAGADIVLVGHSNSAAIICDALRNPNVFVHSIHLIAGAAHADYEANGLNDAVAGGRVIAIHVYRSPNDGVLKKWAGLSRTLGKPFGLGYGNIGYAGPKNMSEAANLVTTVVTDPTMGHSTWLDADHFTDTMQLVTGHRFGPVEK